MSDEVFTIDEAGAGITVRLMRTTISLLSIALAVSACGGVDTSGSVANQACAPVTAKTPAAAALESKFQGSVFTIVIENKSRAQMFQGAKAPYFQSLAKEYAVADGYRDARVHPSLPNYIWMASGQNFGILDDSGPVSHHIDSTSHLVDQIEAVGKTWKAYQESMGTPCKVVSDGQYAVKHNPFVYFDDIVGWQGTTPVPTQRCLDNVVDYAELDKDLASGKVPDYVFITPNMINDMHDGSIEQGDAWLSREVPKILASDAWKSGGVLIITADEGEGRSLTDWSQEDDPPFVLISPLGKKGYTSEVPYDTSSYVKTVQAILGLEPLLCGGTDSGVQTMDDLFETPMPAMR